MIENSEKFSQFLFYLSFLLIPVRFLKLQDMFQKLRKQIINFNLFRLILNLCSYSCQGLNSISLRSVRREQYFFFSIVTSLSLYSEISVDFSWDLKGELGKVMILIYLLHFLSFAYRGGGNLPQYIFQRRLAIVNLNAFFLHLKTSFNFIFELMTRRK